jgi:hypothetical protein
MADLNTGKSVQVDGVVGAFTDYDGLIEALRERAASIGLSFAMIDCLSEFSEGGTGKYLSDTRVRHLSVASLLKITETLGISSLLYVDPELTARMRPMWEKRDELKAHARRRAPIGATTLKRVRPAVLSELGKKGAAARNAKLSPETRRALARAAALARWGYVRIDPKTGLPSVQT